MFLYITNVCFLFCHDLRWNENQDITLLTARLYFCQQKLLIALSIVTSVHLFLTGFLFRFISIIKRLFLCSLSVNSSMILNMQEDIESFNHWQRCHHDQNDEHQDQDHQDQDQEEQEEHHRDLCRMSGFCCFWCRLCVALKLIFHVFIYETFKPRFPPLTENRSPPEKSEFSGKIQVHVVQNECNSMKSARKYIFFLISKKKGSQ